ncbi:nuclear transport factor 2 family protein [Allopusillimonas ginsengisoli]|uniref:nuclear transport factor 2 family protein n=1 Tax=Allopusillimonas ginsengisoli TaxID=453575 RepID=UPI0010C17969|nr:nuclear transport factor 2 family protein [Allopusillimonas ginsengisoli]
MATTTLLNTPLKIATQYVHIWNENNPARRRTLIEQAFTPQASYTDPLMQAVGHEALNAMIGAAQAQFVGLRFSVLGNPDGHNNVVRFSWSLGAPDTEPFATGTDIAVITPDGQFETITGFLDKIPG